MGEYVEVTEKDYHLSTEPEQLLLVEVGDIFDQLVASIRAQGEIPQIDPHRDMAMDAFMMDIFTYVGYLPEGPHGAADMALDVLASCGQYFDIDHLSKIQRQCWLVAVQALIDRFMEYRLYGPLVESTGIVHRYDYQQLKGDMLVLYLPD